MQQNRFQEQPATYVFFWNLLQHLLKKWGQRNPRFTRKVRSRLLEELLLHRRQSEPQHLLPPPPLQQLPQDALDPCVVLLCMSSRIDDGQLGEQLDGGDVLAQRGLLGEEREEVVGVEAEEAREEGAPGEARGGVGGRVAQEGG